MEQDLNLNYAQCIKAKNDLFSTTYYNICDGTEKLVNNGTVDILKDGLFIALIVVFIAMVVVFMRFLWKGGQ